MKPVADYTPCPRCTHPNAFHCPVRGCRLITEVRCKKHEDNQLCGCPDG